MCYICSCFAWTLDLIQRIITFALSCLIVFALCSGMSIAILAGIAYGYNYSLAEFLTFTKSNVTAFIRHGHLFDNPDITFPASEETDQGDDMFLTNILSDEQDNNLQNESNPDSWLKTKDTRQYAEKLTKYSAQNSDIDGDSVEDLNNSISTKARLRHISVAPIPGLATTVWQSGSSQIVMRIFRPMEQLPISDNVNRRDYNRLDKSERVNSKNNEAKLNEDFESVIPVTKVYLLMSTEERNRYMPISSTYKDQRILDYPTEEIDEDNVLYKPV